MNYTKFQTYQQRALATVYEEGDDSFHNNIIPVLAEKYLKQLQIPQQAPILDIGCGSGQFMQTAKTLGYTNVTGVTLSDADSTTCIAQGFNTLLADMSDIPIGDQCIEFVWCRHALEHSPYPLFTLFEFNRICKPGAVLYIDVPAPDNERVLLGEYNSNHYSIMGENMWTALFIKTGFEVLKSEGYSLDIDQLGQIWKERCFIFVIKCV